MEGFQQTQVMVADKEAVKRRKNVEGDEKEVVKRIKIMEGEEGYNLLLQLFPAEKQEHLLGSIDTLVTDTVIHRTRNHSYYDILDYYFKKQDEKLAKFLVPSKGETETSVQDFFKF